MLGKKKRKKYRKPGSLGVGPKMAEPKPFDAISVKSVLSTAFETARRKH